MTFMSPLPSQQQRQLLLVQDQSEDSQYTIEYDSSYAYNTDEGFDSSSNSYSDISSLGTIDATSINSADSFTYNTSKYWCTTAYNVVNKMDGAAGRCMGDVDYDNRFFYTTFPRFFNTFPCITKEEFDDDEYTMGDKSTCSSLISTECSISEDYYDANEEDNSYETDHHTDRVEVLILKEDTLDGRSSSNSSSNSSISHTHLVASRTNYDDTNKYATTVSAETITFATTASPHVCDTFKAHQNEVDATNTSHNGGLILNNENVEVQPNAVEAFLDRMLGLTEDEDEVAVDTETTPEPTPDPIANKPNGSDIADERSGTKSTTNAADTITVASTASPQVCESKPSHNDVSDLDNENVEVRPNAVEAFLDRMLGLKTHQLKMNKDKLYEITKIDLDNKNVEVQPNATEVHPFLDQMFSWMSTETDIVVVDNDKLDGIDEKSMMKTATKVVVEASMSRAFKPEKPKKQSRVPSFVNVMMRSKAPKSSKKSQSENVTLVRSSLIAVEAIAKAPQKVDAKSKNNTKKKMKSSTRTKSKTPPTRSASKKEGIWTEYVDATIGRPYYSNGIITTWKRPPNCPEIRIKRIIKNCHTIPKH